MATLGVRLAESGVGTSASAAVSTSAKTAARCETWASSGDRRPQASKKPNSSASSSKRGVLIGVCGRALSQCPRLRDAANCSSCAGGRKTTSGCAGLLDSPRELAGRETVLAGVSDVGDGVCAGVPLLWPLDEVVLRTSSDMVGG